MNVSAPAAAARVSLERLIDYAGLFPPAALTMEEAVAEYDRARNGAQRWMLGRFIVPASRLRELRALAPSSQPLELSVIVDAASDARSWFGAAKAAFERIENERSSGWAQLAALEIPLPRLSTNRETYDASIGQCAALAAQAGLRDLALYVEVPRDDRFGELLPGAMDALARYRMGGKLRCGGADAGAYPSVDEVAAFVLSATAAHVAFKATAGLHHPVRGWNEAAGVTMHGFLNVLAAAAFAPRASRELIEAIVAEEDPRAFGFDRVLRWRDREADEAELVAMRRGRFAGYGSCSFDEPVDDLRALAILPAH